MSEVSEVSETPIVSSSETETTKTQETAHDFFTSFDEFLRFCSEVLKFKLNNDLKLDSNNKNNIISICLNNYKEILKKSPTSYKHCTNVIRMWESCSKHLKYLSSDEKDVDIQAFAEWLRVKSSVSIQVPVEKTQSKIMITTIYGNCHRIADRLFEDAEKAESQGQKEKADRFYEDPAITYPDKFLLLLFRLVQFSVNAENKIVYTPNPLVTLAISKLETNLNLSENETPETSGNLGELFNIVTDLASSIGIQLPGGMPAGGFDNAQMKKALNQVKSDPGTKKMLSGLFSGLNPNDPSTFPATLNNLMSAMSQNAQKVPEAVQRANAATVENPTGQLTLGSTGSTGSTEKATSSGL